MNKKINTNTMPGFYELLPNEQIAFGNLLEKIKSIYKLYGYKPIETPVLERSEVLLAKGGGDTDKEIYRFKKGDNDIAMRFDLTVPLARYVANKQNDLIFPFKVFNIGKVYRGEKPQAGRFREFYQCDIDIIGRDTLENSFDAELVKVIYDVFKSIGIDNFVIKINNRKVLNGFLRSLNISNTEEVLRVIDKPENVKEQLLDMSLDQSIVDGVMQFLDIKTDVIDNLKKLNVENNMFIEGLNELQDVLTQIDSLEVDRKNFEIDLSIARGLDYYTGTVYETYLTNYPEFGAISSGGRYDDLASYYSNNKFPGVGCSIGLTRLFDCMVKNNLIDISKKTYTKVLVIPMEGFKKNGFRIANTLRENNISTEIYNDFKKAFKYADRNEIPWVIVIGEQEVKSEKYTLKNMETGEQELIDFADLIKKIS